MNHSFQIYLNNKLQLGLGQLGGTYTIVHEQSNTLSLDTIVKVVLKNPGVPQQLLTRKKHLRFAFDFEKLKNFSHQNCVKILDYQEFNGYASFLMQKYDDNLATHSIKRNFDFDITDYLLLLNQITSAYLRLIELGIKYGRFKPQNILVSQIHKEKVSFYLADYGFQRIDTDRSETELYLQVPQINATEEQDDIYQFGICIAQMGINDKMKSKGQLESLHDWLKWEIQQQQIYFEQILHRAIYYHDIQRQNFKLPPLILFILNSMVVYNSNKRCTWKDLMQLLQIIKSANPFKLNNKFANLSNLSRWKVINQINNLNQIPRPLGIQQIVFLKKQQECVQKIQQKQKEQMVYVQNYQQN